MNYLHCSVTKYSVLCMYSILVLIWNRKRCVWRKHMNVVRFFFHSHPHKTNSHTSSKRNVYIFLLFFLSIFRFSRSFYFVLYFFSNFCLPHLLFCGWRKMFVDMICYFLFSMLYQKCYGVILICVQRLYLHTISMLLLSLSLFYMFAMCKIDANGKSVHFPKNKQFSLSFSRPSVPNTRP